MCPLSETNLQAVLRQIYHTHPELRGIQPQVRPHAPKTTTNQPASENILLIFKRKTTTVDGQTLTQWLRVVVNPQGKIIKTTTSR